MKRPTDDEPMETCAKCGEIHELCRGHNARKEPCGKHPMRGQQVCRNHGGRSPQALKAADRRIAERDAVAALESFGVPIVVDHQTALLEELHRTAGAVAWLSAIVADLDRDDLVYGKVREKTGGEDHGTTKEARPNVWYQLWMDQRKHLVDVARECGRAGIEERRVRLAEEQGRMLAGVISRILTGMFNALVSALGEHAAARVVLESAWPQLVGEIVPAELRAVAVSSEAVPA
jgi:hypothetical protein